MKFSNFIPEGSIHLRVRMTNRQLHIGALGATLGWETLNALPLPGIDHVCDAGDLSIFPGNTFRSIYASHVLEHFDYKDSVLAVLMEWHRVLAPGGQIFISVPDMDVICRMIADRDNFVAQDRWNLTRMLLGGHSDCHDYHLTMFNEEILRYFLEKSGFIDICSRKEFNIFADTSSMRYKGELISLNMQATKPGTAFTPESVSVAPEGPGQERLFSFSITRNNLNYRFQYLLDTRKPTQRSLASHIQQGRLYEPEVSLILLRALQRGDCFVDVGANSGFFTIIAAHLVGDEGCVYAFEPESANFERLGQNISLNSLSNVELFQAAAGEKCGDTSLYINRDNDGGHALWDPGAHSYNQLSRENILLQRTDILTLDSVFNRRQESARRIKIIKIDTEGYEHHVLMGGVDTIRRHNIPFILAEINRLGLRQTDTNERTFRLFMHHLGYTAYYAQYQEQGLTLQFQEMPLTIVPHPDEPELVYNLAFCLPGALERCGFHVHPFELS